MTQPGGHERVRRTYRRRAQTWWRWASRSQRALVVAVVVAAAASLPLEVLLRLQTAEVVRYEVERTIGASGDIEVSLGAWPLTPHIVTRSLSTVTVSLESVPCGDLALEDVTLVGAGVRTEIPYVHDLSLRAVLTPEALQAALDRDGGESIGVRIDAGHLVVTTPSDDRDHVVDVSVREGRRVALVVDASTSPTPGLAERIESLSFDASCPVPFGWIDDATVTDTGVVLTGLSEAAALYEREAF